MSLNTTQPPIVDNAPPLQPTKKRAKRQPNTMPPESRPFTKVGALFIRSVEMYCKPSAIVKRQWTMNSGNDDSLSANQDKSDQLLYDEAVFAFFLNNSPEFATAVEDGRDVSEIDEIIRWIDKGCQTARNTDTGIIKLAVANSFGLTDPNRRLGVLPFDWLIKFPLRCGYNSEQTGRLLTPQHMSWDNLQHRANLQTPGCVIPVEVWFRFLYPGGICNPSDPMEHLMEGELVWKGYQVLFSPSSARVSRILPSITPHRVAYVIALLHHALSGAQTINSNFKQEAYYGFIYKFLSAPENETFWSALQTYMQPLVYGPSIPAPPRLLGPVLTLTEGAQEPVIQHTADEHQIAGSQEQDRQIDLVIDPELQDPWASSVAAATVSSRADLSTGMPSHSDSPLAHGFVPASAASPAPTYITIPTSPASAHSPVSATPTPTDAPPVTSPAPPPPTTPHEPGMVAAQSNPASAKRRKGNDGKAITKAGSKGGDKASGKAKGKAKEVPSAHSLKRATRSSAVALTTATNTHRDSRKKRVV